MENFNPDKKLLKKEAKVGVRKFKILPMAVALTR